MLLVTTKEGKGRKTHTHLVYISEDGTAAVAENSGHTHEISHIEGQPADIAPDGTVLSQATEPGWLLYAAEDHTHTIDKPVNLQQKNPFKISNSSEDEKLSMEKVQALFKEARELERDAFKDAEEAERFYEGDQWEESQRSDLEAKKRAVLTINEIAPKIDTLSGIQRQNRMDVRFRPSEDGDARVADILSIVVKHVHGRTNFEQQESLAFEDQSIAGRGLYHIDTSFDEDIRGKTRIRRFNWRNVHFGPHEELDASDADYMIKHEWLSMSKLKEMYPDKADEIDIDFQAIQDRDKADSRMEISYANEWAHVDKDNTSPHGSGEFTNISRKEHRLMECWQKVYARVHVAMMPTDGYYETLTGWDKSDLKQLMNIPGMIVIERVIYQFRVTIVAGNVVLDDDFPDMPTIEGQQFFDIVPIYSKKRRNRFWGRVHSAIDPQREINKRHSQATDVLNRVAPYGWIFFENTFPDEIEEKEFKENAGTPGFTAKVTDPNNAPTLVQGIKFPSEIASLMQLDSQKIQEVMNINSDMLGMHGGSRVSGLAVRENRRAGLLGNDFLFDNLGFARQRLALMTVAHIQKYWSPDRILRILGYAAQNPDTVGAESADELTVGGTPAKQLTPQDVNAIRKILEDEDLTTYDAKVSESPNAPTQRLGNFMMLSELAGQGVPVAPTTLLRMSDIPDKQRAIQELQQYMEQQMAPEKLKSQTELGKTLIKSQGDAI